MEFVAEFSCSFCCEFPSFIIIKTDNYLFHFNKLVSIHSRSRRAYSIYVSFAMEFNNIHLSLNKNIIVELVIAIKSIEASLLLKYIAIRAIDILWILIRKSSRCYTNKLSVYILNWKYNSSLEFPFCCVTNGKFCCCI